MIVPFPSCDPELALVGARLHAAREGRGVGLEELAALMRITPERLRRAEGGRERLTSAELYGAILALSLPLDLLFRSDIAAPPG